MSHKRPIQADRILAYMKEHGGITSLDASRDLGCIRLGARIFELKERGHDIKSEFIEVEDRYGEKCRVKRYWLGGTE